MYGHGSGQSMDMQMNVPAYSTHQDNICSGINHMRQRFAVQQHEPHVLMVLEWPVQHGPAEHCHVWHCEGEHWALPNVEPTT